MARQIDTYLEPLLDEERFAFYQAVCDFSDAEIAPRLLSWEREHQLTPDDVLRKMGELGLFGLTVREEFGGQGGTHLDLILMGLALGYHSQSVAITPGAASSLGTKPLQLFGRDEQKKAHLPDLAAGKRMFVFGLSEPGRGSDATNPEVVAVRKGDSWVIKGEKCWSTNARWASHVVVHALTDPNGRPGYRSTCFIVPMDAKGVHYQEMEGKQVWLQSSTGSIAFDEVEVPADAILGEENEGFKVMATTLNGGRLFIAGLSLASLAFMLDKCRTYVQERIQFDDKPIGRFQRVQDVLLDMDIALHQGVTWLLHLVKEYDAGTMRRESAAKVKIECSRRASELAILAMDICGGVSCLDEFGLIRHNRDLFVCRVGEGSNFALKSLSTRPLVPEIANILE
ncbi:MAG: acyl-CoA/acyl-ACP dehydrogenase [Candidatus Eisenbacteria bacterium]|uniref:Acyl-CoA/acyl-ACP dehydrogenase n=1 Tax=Eiseniibacteriota bacterium TaxID=2212470 RepID=A0A956NJW3_UNCEI|nr:acyl-CoA/acyl-ACP dehydrogenase [Candidatus Eisenbacteria bacterium]MCB9465642.1 acyl-CoA/acyl-ACP dehydrogenase [Candidatus Eisenbacteria bacterium]